MVIFGLNLEKAISGATGHIVTFSDWTLTSQPLNFFKVWKKILNRLFETLRISYMSIDFETLENLWENFSGPKIKICLKSGPKNDFSALEKVP